MPRRNHRRKLVQRLIVAMSMSRAELAARMRVSAATLYAWTVGRRSASLDSAMRLVEVAEQQAGLVIKHAQRLRDALEREAARDS